MNHVFAWKSPFLQDSCQLFYGPGWLTLCQCYLKIHDVGEGPGATLWVLRHFLSLISSFCSVQFSHSVVSDVLQPHGLQQARLPCPSPTPGACSDSCPSSWWCHPTISSSVIPFSFSLQSFPALGTFLMSRAFSNELASGGQSTGASASASGLPVNIQDWFPLRLTGLISLKSKGLSRVFSNTTFQKINSLMLSLLYGPTLTSIHQKIHNFDYMDLCRQSNVSAF